YGYAVETAEFADGRTLNLINNLTLRGTAAGDSINGLSDNNTLIGGGGLDYLYGKGGDDILYGDEGDDRLYGDEGNDILYGGNGIDLLYGGAGADTFVFDSTSALNNSDNIQDFKVSQGDMIDVSDLLSAYDPLTD